MKKKRVLLVDDNKQFLEAASKIIKAANHAVLIGGVTTGEEAVEKIEHEHPDIVLMDVSMPGIGGMMATRLIKKMVNPPQVIILTLYDTSEYRNEAKAAGADGFISKSDFVDKISDIFSGKFVQ
ncbi:MAG: response regulator transcription factor [Stygiobacter sp.]|uniref:Response regulator transcription factor n=1 Tax=Stygiobacter electus TaxID=3032292 RepID=A0AAE3P0W5_9BACT|nr:response regulator transcription factor [Stygiobacter electus]MDF1612054.1 response regulator transcription factor [Stygiobacter electus]